MNHPKTDRVWDRVDACLSTGNLMGASIRHAANLTAEAQAKGQQQRQLNASGLLYPAGLYLHGRWRQALNLWVAISIFSS